MRWSEISPASFQLVFDALGSRFLCRCVFDHALSALSMKVIRQSDMAQFGKSFDLAALDQMRIECEYFDEHMAADTFLRCWQAGEIHFTSSGENGLTVIVNHSHTKPFHFPLEQDAEPIVNIALFELLESNIRLKKKISELERAALHQPLSSQADSPSRHVLASSSGGFNASTVSGELLGGNRRSRSSQQKLKGPVYKPTAGRSIINPYQKTGAKLGSKFKDDA